MMDNGATGGGRFKVAVRGETVEDGSYVYPHHRNVYKWEPIETAPNDDELLDLWIDGDCRLADAKWVYGTWCHWDHRMEDWEPITNSITHWMRVEGPNV